MNKSSGFGRTDCSGAQLSLDFTTQSFTHNNESVLHPPPESLVLINSLQQKSLLLEETEQVIIKNNIQGN